MGATHAEAAAPAHAAVPTRAAAPARESAARPAARPTARRPDSRITAAYDSLPLLFERNEGQFESDVRFASHGMGYTFLLRPGEAQMTLAVGKGEKETTTTVRMSLEGADRNAAMSGENPLQTSVNYFIGRNPAEWHRDVDAFGKVRYDDVYPGTDLVYYGHGGKLEYDFIVEPGADPRAVALRFDGGRTAIDAAGQLVVSTEIGEIAHQKPYVYQEVGGRHVEVASRFVSRGDAYGFELGEYDHSAPLVIDPSVAYGTRLGPVTEVQALAVDPSGALFIGGKIRSAGMQRIDPVQAEGHHNSGWDDDAFVMKLSPDGGTVLFSTYLGGLSEDEVLALAVDGAGSVYVGGQTGSREFPSTPGVFQPEPVSAGWADYDGFLMKIAATGNTLLYSTFIGAYGTDSIVDIAVDASGNAIVVGATADSQSYDFPLTADDRIGYGYGYVAKFSPDASQLIYSLPLHGGAGNNAVGDHGMGVAVDQFGNAYIAARTTTKQFPTTPGAFQTRSSDAPTESILDTNCFDAIVVKLDPNGNTVYSTFLGGSGEDEATDIAVDSGGNAYVVGNTKSSDFPVVNAFQPSFAGSPFGDIFVAKLNPTGTQLVYSTYLGGDDAEFPAGIAVDAAGRAIVAGYGSYTNFPLQDSWLPTDSTSSFFTIFSPTGATLDFSTHIPLGVSALTVDSTGSAAYLAGSTGSALASITPMQNPYYNYGGTSAIKVLLGDPKPALTPGYFSPSAGPSAGGYQFTLCDAFEGIDKRVHPFSTFQVSFGTTPATNVGYTYDGYNCISGTVPAHSAGPVDITLQTSEGTSGVLRNGLRYFDVPFTVTEFSPTTLPGPGGAAGELTIRGTGFTKGTEVSFQRPQANYSLSGSVELISDTELRVRTVKSTGYEELPGTFDLVVKPEVEHGNWKTVTKLAAIQFTNPVVVHFDPVEGTTQGDTALRVDGYGLGNPTSVTFGGVPARIGDCLNCFPMTVYTPPHDPGFVDIVWTTASGSHTIPNGYKYIAPRPTSSSMSPNSGPPAGGGVVTITGTGFQSGARVTFAGVLSPSVTVVNAQTINAVVPPHPPGRVPVAVTNLDGQYTRLASDGSFTWRGYTYSGPELNNRPNPAFGPTAGGTLVSLFFSSGTPPAGTTVTFDGLPATFSSIDSSTLKVLTPAHAIGDVDVVVTFPSGESDRYNRGFTYRGPAPTIATFTPTSGPSDGGTLMTVTGTNFTPQTRVFIGKAGARTTFQSSTTLTAIVPRLLGAVAGPRDVSVWNIDDQSATHATTFLYVEGPEGRYINPTAGPSTGGTTVTINGDAFDNAVQVTFGGVPATSVTRTSASELTVVTPAHAVGAVAVVVSNGDGQTSTIPSGFRYLAPAPTVTGFTPATGFVGDAVTITGTNFVFVTAVKFNNAPALFSVVNDTQINATIPQGASTGPIKVVTDSGEGTSATNFVVQSAAALIENFTPASGGSGTVVTITGQRMGGAFNVTFGGASASSFSLTGTTQITAVTPANGNTGPICIDTPGGYRGCSATDFVFGPRITGFTPTSAVEGTAVTINGANFAGATTVAFAGVNATPFTVNQQGTAITTTVPVGAMTGPVTVTTPIGTGTSAMPFGIPPAITSFTPIRTGPGNVVTITGQRFTGATAVSFSGAAATFSVVNDTTVSATVPVAAANGPISITTPGGTGISADPFTVADSPAIGGFTPNKGAPGTTVTITGTNFSGATSVRFNGVSTTFSVVNGGKITATVPSTALNGPISITNGEGTGTSEALFYLPPNLSSFAPNAAVTGANITITGNNFLGATAVTFNGTPALFTVQGQDHIMATVPASATSGTLSVVTPYGPASSAFPFSVLAPTTPSVVATATSGTSIVVSWIGQPSHTYDVRRITHKSQSFDASAIVRLTGTTYVDNTVSPGTTYLYNILDVTTGVIGNNDYATTIIFSDEPLPAGTAVKAIHVSELRAAVNALRLAADLPPATFTDTVTPGLFVRAIHITQMRSALTEALIGLGRYATFTDDSLTAGMPIRAPHLREIRDAVK